MSERYTETAIHSDVERLPSLLSRSVPAGPLAVADLECGDGPLFAALSREGLIDATRPARVPIPGYYSLEVVLEH